MNAYLNYLLEANLGLCFFLVFYFLLFAKETDFRIKRGFMLMAVMVSLLFPLLHFNTTRSLLPSLGELVPATWLSEVTIQADGHSTASVVNPTHSIWWYLILIYGIGVTACLTLFLIRLVRLLRMISRADARRHDAYLVIESTENKSTFSFFRFIFIGQADQLSASEKQLIIDHEHVHAQQLHSIDILLVNLLSILFWFNPAVRMYKKIFVQLHEFEADARAVSDRDVNDYCSLLAKVALLSADFPLANHFNNSLTVKRIDMIRRIKTNIRNWKLATMLAVFSIFFVVAACHDQVAREVPDVAQNPTIATDLPEEIQAHLDQLKKERPDKKFVVIDRENSGVIEGAVGKAQSLDEILKAGQIDAANISTMWVLKDKTDKNGNLRSFIIIEYDEQTRAVADQTQSGEPIFTVVEQNALPAGGMEGLTSFLQQNLLYPKEAREQGLEGTVFVQFVVNTDGSLSDFTTIKGVSPLLDAEAVRVAKTFPAWTPGKQNGVEVRQRFVLPINFRLNNKNVSAPEITEVKEDLKILSTTTESSGKKFIEGKVTDAAGNPLLGVNLIIAGTTHGTTTDAGGNFKLEISQKPGKVAVSFVGYKTNVISF